VGWGEMSCAAGKGIKPESKTIEKGRKGDGKHTELTQDNMNDKQRETQTVKKESAIQQQ